MIDKRTEQIKLFSAIAAYFGTDNLARKLNITRQAITDWKERGAVPPKQAIKLEKIFQGRIKAHELVQKETIRNEY